MSGDDPTPPYADWPDLCDKNLQTRLALGAMDEADLMHRVKIRKPFPASVLPDDFGNFWVQAYHQTYGGASKVPDVSASDLNDAYHMTWLVLWFQTSGKLWSWFQLTPTSGPACKLVEPMEPPDSCGDSPTDSRRALSLQRKPSRYIYQFGYLGHLWFKVWQFRCAGCCRSIFQYQRKSRFQ